LACFALLDSAERAHDIPAHLLKAIALTESGRRLKGGRMRVVPWPWTINVQGKGYFFPSKEKAIEATRRFQAQGIRSIDVGYMQINLHHHAKAFRSLEEAFDPVLNIRYGARFLKRLKAQKGHWHRAIAHYHSADPVHHGPYRQRVLKTWAQTRQIPYLQLARGARVPVIAPLKRAKERPIAAQTSVSPVLERPDFQKPETLVRRVYALKRAGAQLAQGARLSRVSSPRVHLARADPFARVRDAQKELMGSTPPRKSGLSGQPVQKIPPLWMCASYKTRSPHLRPTLVVVNGLKRVG
jgi:hypothetical protein